VVPGHARILRTQRPTAAPAVKMPIARPLFLSNHVATAVWVGRYPPAFIPKESMNKIHQIISRLEDNEKILKDGLILIQNGLTKSYELTVIPFPPFHALMEFRENERTFPNLKGTEIELVKKGILTND
jgi:hypothetical protein